MLMSHFHSIRIPHALHRWIFFVDLAIIWLGIPTLGRAYAIRKGVGVEIPHAFFWMPFFVA
jgi:hypothetical protein